jgi:hypothetical protein
MANQPKISEEIKKMEYEPLLPAEKKFIIYNLLIGTILLVLLVWVSHTFFPVTGMQANPEPAQAQHAPAAPAQAEQGK